MNPFLIIGGLAALYLILSKQNAAITAEISSLTGKPSTTQTGVVVGAAPPPVNIGSGIHSATSTDSDIQAGVGTASQALNFVPVVGPALGQIANSIASLFTASHAAAVAKEASTLNSATPTFLNGVTQTIEDLNQGAITPAQAISYLQQAQSNYYTTVSQIIKKGGPCVASCTIGAQSSAGKPVGWVSTQPVCCNNSNTCNASCCVGCYIVEPTVTKLTAVIQAGGGSVFIPSSQDNGAIQGTPSVTLTYAKPVTSFISALGL